MSQGALEGFVGRFGSGKTLLMTWRAFKAHALYDEVWSNYGLNPQYFRKTKVRRIESGPHFFTMIAKALADEDGRPKGTKRLILLDEIHSLFDARAWNQVPVEALTPLSQLRKAGLSVWYTSQHESQVEKRIRNYTNLMWLCKAWGRDFNFRSDTPLMFWASCFDNFEFRQRGAQSYGSIMFRPKAKRFRLYDTFEVVQRMDLEGVGAIQPVREVG